MNYTDNKKILKQFYDQYELTDRFINDNLYLEQAFDEITSIWLDNFNQIEVVNYLMIAEAPLWGKDKKYIYNPSTNNTQFFHRSDLAEILNVTIINKRDFIDVCNKIGLLIIDISPFPLNTYDTSINYRMLTKKQYRELVSLTLPTYFEKKVKLVSEKKKSPNIKTFFRYARVQKTFENLISEALIENNIIQSKDEIGEVSKQGGGIDKIKLSQIMGINM